MRLALHSQLFARVIPMRSDLCLSRENSLHWLPKVAASNPANFVWLVDTYAHRWYKSLHLCCQCYFAEAMSYSVTQI